MKKINMFCVYNRPLASVSLAMLLATAASPALAQTSPVTEGNAEDGANAGEIVVTAQRRAERSIDVPIAITAADGEALTRAGVTNVTNIGAIAPSIMFRSNKDASSSSNLQIRGIGTTGTAYSFEGAVGVFIDGVYRTRSGQALSNFLDVESLQILRGPQGTLFGKNTSAGALIITSVRPSTSGVAGKFEASYGNLDSYSARAALNLPLSDRAALRVSGVVDGREGSFKTPTGGKLDEVTNRGVKAHLLVEPSDSVTIRLIADYAKTGGNCCWGTIYRGTGAAQPLIEQLILANGQTPPSTDGSKREALLNEFGRYTSVEDYGATLSVEADIGSGQLTSTTAIRKFDEASLTDPDYSGADIVRITPGFKSRFISQELTYTGELNGAVRAKYAVGGFFSDEDLEVNRSIFWGEQAQAYFDVILNGRNPNAAPGLATVERFPGSAKSRAVFTHWTFELSEMVNLIAGVRYTHESKRVQFENPFFRDTAQDPFVLLGVQPGRLYDRSTTDDFVSGTLGLQYKPNRNTMFYLTYNRGAKAGGVAIDVNAGGTPTTQSDPAYKPEKIDAFELGAKANWLGGRAFTNAAVFYNKMSDLQVAQFQGLNFVVLNAPSAKSYGFEVDQTFRLSDAVRISMGGLYLPKATFGQSTQLGAPLSGRRFNIAPKLSGNVALNIDTPISSSLDLTGSGQLEYRGKHYTSTVLDTQQDEYMLVNASIGIKDADGSWTIEAFGRNLTNVDYVTYDSSRPLQRGSGLSYLGDPRTYGVRVRYEF